VPLFFVLSLSQSGGLAIRAVLILMLLRTRSHLRTDTPHVPLPGSGDQVRTVGTYCQVSVSGSGPLLFWR
jgi:hypothetical protein